MLPASSRFVIVGAGMHGLSTAYHLAVELRQRNSGSGADVVVLEKATPGAGATGIACGVVRNNYFQPAMSELMQACVEVWESDPGAYHYNSVGYIALGPQVQESDLSAVYERHQRIGYRSDLYLGAAEVDAHMKDLFPDWRAKGVTACLHEHQGGFAFNVESVMGLRDKCLAENVQIHSYTEVTGFRFGVDDTVTAVETDKGPIMVGEQVVIAPGPWAKRFWGLLGLPMTIDIHTPSGDVARDQPMWTYWNLQEGEITVDPLVFDTADGGAPPVIHLDTDAPLYSDAGDLITDELWGIYFKRDRTRRAGWGLTSDRRRRRRARPVSLHDERRRRVPRHVVRRALARDGPVRGLPEPLQAGPLGRRRLVHGGQLPGVRLPQAERLRDPRLEPRLQDDRRRPRGGAGDVRRRGTALDAVPLRALRDRRPPPGLALALPLVVALAAGFSRSPGSHAAIRHRTYLRLEAACRRMSAC